MYKVIKSFVDLQDNGHLYLVGDVYPRQDVIVPQIRINELLSESNKMRTPLIEEVKESKPMMNKPAKARKGKKDDDRGDLQRAE